ncbi:MAG: MXAN_2562 family outer membrane beta-barrel protein [Nitrospirota bacterium]
MNVRTIVLSLVLLLLIPVAVHAAEPAPLKPHWSVEVKGGYFYPDIDNWKTYYGDDRTWHYAGSLAYKVLRQVELGIEGGYIKDRGLASAPLNSAFFGGQVLTGRVDYELAPLNVFVLIRGVFKETQWLVPYAGGGWTRMYYRVKTDGQATVRGSVNGYHGRAGIQLLLDEIDPHAAHNLSADYGIQHTYLFGEVQVTHATVGTPEVNLGGTSYLMGFLFEF